MAGEVDERRAAIFGQGRREAVELMRSVDEQYRWSTRLAYRAGGNIRDLGVGQASGNEGNESNESGGELHFDS